MHRRGARVADRLLAPLSDLGARHRRSPSAVGRLDHPIKGVEDLFNARVLTLAGSTSERFLNDYGIALPQGSPRREAINTRLLEMIRGEAWQPLLSGYLGQAG